MVACGMVVVGGQAEDGRYDALGARRRDTRERRVSTDAQYLL